MDGSGGAFAGDVRTSKGVRRPGKGGAALAALARGLLPLAAALTALAAPALAADHPPSTPSGLPVPRYVSLKFNEVNARAGPGDDHRLLWTYHVKGLPVQVVAETDQWRRICDPQLGLAWVHSRTVDGRRTVLQALSGPLPLRVAPKPTARVRAYMASRSIGSLDRCKDGWCRISVAGVEGWAPADMLWGTAEAPQCR
jgi:SH3-like domain-containing protein